MKISINIPFWYSNEERLYNLNITYKTLKHLQSYLTLNGLDVDVNVFEFSKDKQYFKDSVYIPIYGNYEKSLKINTALQFLNQNPPDIISFIDGDCFVDKKEYSKVLNTFQTFNPLKYYCNNLIKLENHFFFNQDTFEVTSCIQFKDSGTIDGLGGFWMCDFKTLYEIGGFDEQYKGWGREDEDLGKRLTLKGLTFERLPFSVYHLPHPIEKTKYDFSLRAKQEEIYKKTNTIIRPSLLNNYQC